MSRPAVGAAYQVGWNRERCLSSLHGTRGIFILRGKPIDFQELILKLQDYWAKYGCLIGQPYDVETGAGTFNPATFLRSLGPEPWKAAYVEPSRRATARRAGGD